MQTLSCQDVPDDNALEEVQIVQVAHRVAWDQVLRLLDVMGRAVAAKMVAI